MKRARPVTAKPVKSVPARPVKPAKPSQPTLRLVVHLVDLPAPTFCEYADIDVGLGRGKGAVAGVKEKGGLRFEAEARVARKGATVNLLGPDVFGKPLDRFLYLVWTSARAGAHGGREMFRRLKIKLDMPAALVEKALAKGAPLHVTMSGTSGDGGPACATRAPLEGWALRA